MTPPATAMSMRLGTLSVGRPGGWTGDIPVGATVTITSTAPINNPDTGNHILTATAVSAAPGTTARRAAPTPGAPPSRPC